jgi:hypothetical protein
MPLDFCSNCQRVKQWTQNSDETSLLLKVLSTNDAPSEFDADQIRRMVAGYTEELAMLDHEIAGIIKLVADLEKARQALREHVTQCKTALSPIRRLPTEVLAEILQVVPEKSYNDNGVIIARESPVPLAHICSLWRSTTFSIPHIWSFIDVTLINSGKKHLTRRREAIQLHLSLSKGAPLSIALNCKTEKAAQSFVHALVPYFPRCQFLYVDLPVPTLTYLNQYAGSFSDLRGITFHGHIEPFDIDESQACDAFSKAPALTMASIWGFYHWDHLFLPWSQLTRLDLMLCGNECFAVLEQAVNIEECRLYFIQEDEFASDFDPPITLAHLRALDIIGDESGLPLLFNIHVPALEIFSCWMDVDGYDPYADTVHNFVGRNQTIKQLSLHGSLVSTGFIEVLRLPYLRELCIYDWHVPKHV